MECFKNAPVCLIIAGLGLDSAGRIMNQGRDESSESPFVGSKANSNNDGNDGINPQGHGFSRDDNSSEPLSYTDTFFNPNALRPQYGKLIKKLDSK